MSKQVSFSSHASLSPWPTAWDAIEYWSDACQRSVLFLDILRERGERYAVHNAKWHLTF